MIGFNSPKTIKQSITPADVGPTEKTGQKFLARHLSSIELNDLLKAPFLRDPPIKLGETNSSMIFTHFTVEALLRTQSCDGCAAAWITTAISLSLLRQRRFALFAKFLVAMLLGFALSAFVLLPLRD
jgi:hypothetical protein